MIKTKITENFNTIPKLSTFGIELNKGVSGKQMIAYWTALQQWASVMGFQLTELLTEIKDLDPHPTSYYSGQRAILKEVLGEK
jgi:hypothetical protein